MASVDSVVHASKDCRVDAVDSGTCKSADDKACIDNYCATYSFFYQMGYFDWQTFFENKEDTNEGVKEEAGCSAVKSAFGPCIP